MEYVKSCDRFIAEMRDAGSTTEDVRRRFLDFGWHPKSVDSALSEAGVGMLDEIILGPDLTGLPTHISAYGTNASVVMRMHDPDVCLLANALTPSECQDLIELAKPKLRRSKVYVSDAERSSDGVVSYVRTSQQAGFCYGESDAFDRIYERLSVLVRWPITHMESLHVVRYLPGADFAPHHGI